MWRGLTGICPLGGSLLQSFENIQLLQRLSGRDVQLVAVSAHLVGDEVVIQQRQLLWGGAWGWRREERHKCTELEPAASAPPLG